MDPVGTNAFAAADANLDYSLKLAIARDVQQQFSAILNEALPPSLKRLIDQLEEKLRV